MTQKGDTTPSPEDPGSQIQIRQEEASRCYPGNKQPVVRPVHDRPLSQRPGCQAVWPPQNLRSPPFLLIAISQIGIVRYRRSPLRTDGCRR
jgi:hypothetical protein